MKTKFTVPIIAVLSVCLFIRAQKIDPTPDGKVQSVDTIVVYTADARAIIDQKCFGCHNPEAKNEKARKKLMWDELPKLAKDKQLKTMNDMLEVMGEGKMPPAKFLEFKPEAKLTDAEAKTLTDWAEANAIKLMK
jgi:cytochrome c551/c552